MDSALQKMSKYEGTVKRSLSDFGIPDVDEFVESYVPGELKIFNEYLSSSTEVYDDSFQIQYVIQSKNGRDIRKYNSTEKEILLSVDHHLLLPELMDIQSTWRSCNGKETIF